MPLPPEEGVLKDFLRELTGKRLEPSAQRGKKLVVGLVLAVGAHLHFPFFCCRITLKMETEVVQARIGQGIGLRQNRCRRAPAQCHSL